MNPERQVRRFRNGRNQALRIPRDLELPGRVATLRKEGPRLIVEPVAGPSLLEVLATQTWISSSPPAFALVRRDPHVDIALLPACCNRGLGMTLMRALQAEAAAEVHVQLGIRN